MDTEQLESYLHEQIPASALLQIRVKSCSERKVELLAPLHPNINHKNTVFGGSLSMLAILSGWSLVFMRLAGTHNEIVIQQSRISYLRPAKTDVTATSGFEAPAQWHRFERSFERKGKARIVISSDILCDGEIVAVHDGTYVAFNREYGHGEHAPL